MVATDGAWAPRGWVLAFSLALILVSVLYYLEEHARARRGPLDWAEDLDTDLRFVAAALRCSGLLGWSLE